MGLVLMRVLLDDDPHWATGDDGRRPFTPVSEIENNSFPSPPDLGEQKHHRTRRFPIVPPKR
jgi:hypothetical protein